MRICIVSYDYPYKSNNRFTFVKQLADELVNQGHEVCVISPFNITQNKSTCKKVSMESNGHDEYVTVIRPSFISLPSLCGIQSTLLFHKFVLNRAFKSLPSRPDFIYCHFWSAGYEVYEFAIKNKIPLFIASGESSVDEMFPLYQRKLEYLNHVSGLICVSSKNMKESIDLDLISESNCCVFPNSIDNSVFKDLSQRLCREELGFPLDKFIISYVGWFNERKGSSRVSAAIDKLDSNDICSIFIGKGDEEPNCKNILFKGPLKHTDIPKYLCASDVFVLPTRREGCCNAVVEAMACGLPIISSNLPFNWDILTHLNSIMIDPDNVDAISDAIALIKSNRLLQSRLRKGALATASSLTISNRVEKIIEFISSKMNKNSQIRPKVIVLYNKLFHYRVPVWNLLAEKCDLTVTYSQGDGVIPDGLYCNFKILYLPAKMYKKRFVVQKDNLSKIVKNYDVAIIYGDISWLKFFAVPWFTKTKVVYHSLGVSASYEKHYDEHKEWDWLNKIMLNKADAIAFYTDYPIEKYAKMGIPRSKMFEAPNTVAVNPIVERVAKNSILFIGTLYRQKGIQNLLDSYLELRDTCTLPILNIVGDGPDFEHFKNWIKVNNMEIYINLLGAIYDPLAKAECFASALACISPQQAGLSVLESMGYGVPYITTTDAFTGGERFNIHDKIDGILMDDISELTSIIKDIAIHPDEYVKMGKKAKEFYDNNRTPLHMANGLWSAVTYALNH